MDIELNISWLRKIGVYPIEEQTLRRNILDVNDFGGEARVFNGIAYLTAWILRLSGISKENQKIKALKNW